MTFCTGVATAAKSTACLGADLLFQTLISFLVCSQPQAQPPPKAHSAPPTISLPAGSTKTIDFRRLCNANSDYTLTDLLGHTYYAQICGTAARSCLPSGWENEYEYGRVIQSWGDAPSCGTAECVEERTGAPACCTASCQVIAVQAPVLTPITNGDPSLGVQLTYQGEQPTISDPYHCDWNVATGSPFPRVTHMQFFCDPTVTGFASFFDVSQNATDDCEYFLSFKTSEVCLDAASISSGWIFNIVVLSSFGLYAIVGSLINLYGYGSCAFPNRAFWAEVESLAFDGFKFAVTCGRARGGSKGAYSSAASGGASSSFGVGQSSTAAFSSVANSDAPAFSVAVSSSSADSRTGYNAVGVDS